MLSSAGIRAVIRQRFAPVSSVLRNEAVSFRLWMVRSSNNPKAGRANRSCGGSRKNEASDKVPPTSDIFPISLCISLTSSISSRKTRLGRPFVSSDWNLTTVSTGMSEVTFSSKNAYDG